MNRLAALAAEKEAALKAMRDSGLSPRAFGVNGRCGTIRLWRKPALPRPALAQEAETLLARFPNAAVNKDERRRLRAELSTGRCSNCKRTTAAGSCAPSWRNFSERARMPTADERREAVRARVAYWARRLNVRPRSVRIQRMTRKWGSCSTLGTVTLAADLADREAGFQDFVIAHELLHLRVPTPRQALQGACLAAHLPDWKQHDMQRR